MQDNQPLWTPSDEFRRHSPMFAFMEECNRRFDLSLSDFASLHSWSITERESFWTAVWDFCGIKGKRGERALINGDLMLEARFFPDAELNFAENLLSKSGEGDALVFWGKTRCVIAGPGIGSRPRYHACNRPIARSASARATVSPR